MAAAFPNPPLLRFRSSVVCPNLAVTSGEVADKKLDFNHAQVDF